MKNKFG